MTEHPDRAGDAAYFGIEYFGQDNYFHGYDNYGGRGFWASTLKAIDKYLPMSGKATFLDIGSAFGFLLKHELDYGNVFAVGVDISRPALLKSRIIAPGAGVAEINLDRDPLPFADGTFDFVTALDVAEHMHDFGKAIREMFRVLRTGGIFVIGTPITDTPEGRLWGKVDRDLSHVSKPTRFFLMQTLLEAGSVILESKYYFPLPWIKVPVPRTNMEIVARKKG